MAMMMGNLHNALVAAGAPEDKAQAAAEEAYAGAHTHDGDIKDLRGDIANVRADLRVLKWMVGTMFAAVLAIFYKVWGF